MFRFKKRLVFFLAAGSFFVMAGCSDVQLSPAYSALLDTTAALSDQTAQRARQGRLTPDQMTQALTDQATAWQRFVDARDGKASK